MGGETSGYSPLPAPEIKGLISSEEGKRPPSLPHFPQAGEWHLCSGPCNCGVPSYLDLRVVCVSLQAESLLVCLSIGKILQSKTSLLIRHRTYGAPEAGSICGRMENSLSRAGILRLYQA